MTNPSKKSILNIIWDHLAPIRPEEVVKTDVPPEPELERVPTAEELKIEHDAEIARMAVDVEYYEAKKKLQERLDKVAPRRGVFSKQLPQTVDSHGKRINNSLAARVWRRVPLKPVVLPITFVLIVVLIYARAC